MYKFPEIQVVCSLCGNNPDNTNQCSLAYGAQRRHGSNTHFDFIERANILNNQQQLIDDQVKEWAKADVGTLSSFANMENLLKREYYGRFIIELIQNARDAWYALEENPKKSVVRIILHGDDAQPVLTVCNQGLSFNSERLLKHITQFGESSKTSGEGIGHKGIGFKSVLEITRIPEIYSRENSDGDFTLRVGFDPRKSETLLKQTHMKSWDDMVREYDKDIKKSKEQRLPVLRFPHWIEKASELIQEESSWNDVKFNTLIRLPYEPEFDSILNINIESWRETIETAMEGIKDEIVMLIDAFEQVVIENKLKGEVTCIKAESVDPKKIDDNVAYQRIVITRNDNESSNWLLYKKNIEKADNKRLSQEITVGVRYTNRDGMLIPCMPDDNGRCFHLFFPTRIDSKLPFLFHAYFEVDAGRMRFAPDAIETNKRLLNELKKLFICVIKDLIEQDKRNEFLISELPALFQRTDGSPDDLQANEFRKNLLDDLDLLPWVAVKYVAEHRTGKPDELLLHKNSEISLGMMESFTPSYAWEKACRLIPNSTIDGINFIAGRLQDNAFSLETFKKLLQPGKTSIWTENENSNFVKLLELINKLQALIGKPFIDIIEELRSTDDSRIIPTSTADGVKFVPLPSMHIRGQGKSDLAVFARLTAKSTLPLTPPECLKIAFVDDGIMNAELLSGPGQLLGIRDYNVQTILDRLKTENSYADKDNQMILNFVWQLLLKEDASSYGVKSVVEKLGTFSPGSWWWYQKVRGRSDNEMDDQRRSKALNSLKLPAKSGRWVAAENLVFGKKWASQLASLKGNDIDAAISTRISSFNDLEELAPDDDSIVADPDTISNLMSLTVIKWEDSDSFFLPDNEDNKRLLLMFCFLQRLGVWEIMPAKAIIDYTKKTGVDPWKDDDQLRTSHRNRVSEEVCDFNDYKHQNIQIAEDFDWVWPLKDSKTFLNSLSCGCHFYTRLTHMMLFCSGCRTHRTWKYNSTDAFQPSLLLWRLINKKWLRCDIGDGNEETYSPTEVWWESNIPEAARMRTSPLRFLPIARSMNVDTARLCRLKSLDKVDIADIEKLLIRLRCDYDSEALFKYVSKDSSFRQAFIGLHQRLYSRLRQINDQVAANLCISKVELLCEIGGLLVWQSISKCKYDNGNFATYKHHFISDVHFCVLSRGDEDSAVANFLKIPDFEVKVDRSDNGKYEDVTSEFSILNDRLVHLFSLIVYYKIGASSLNIASNAFSQRLQRIKNLRIRKVDDLHLTLSVDGTNFSKTIGKGNSGNMYLDNKTDPSQPLIYHDYKEPDWPELLRPRIAPYISEMIENHAYSDAITLLYQCPDSDLPYFLNERGISENEMAAIRAAIGQSDKMLQVQANVWWYAVLELLGITHNPLPDNDVFSVVSILIETSSLPGDFKHKLLKHTDVEHAREDTEGILLEIELAEYSLKALNAILVRQNDQGISIRIPKQLFLDWLSKYEKELAYTLYKLGVQVNHAKDFSRDWKLPECLCFRVNILLNEVIEHFASALNEQCKPRDKQFNAQALSHDTFRHLSTLCNESPQELSDNSKLFYSDEERQRIHRNNFAEIKRRLTLFITVIKTSLATPSFKIRETHQSVLDAISPCFDAAVLIEAVRSLCGQDATSFVGYVSSLLADQLLEIPGKDDMQKSLGIDLNTLAKIQAVLTQTNREKVDQMRKKIAELKLASIDFKPYQGSCVKPTKASTAAIKNITPCHVTPKNQRLLKKMGSDAEQWVLAAQLDQIEKLCKESIDKFRSCLCKMAGALERYYEGPSVKKLISCKERALLDNLHDDERLEALSDFIHLSKESDMFGCDILGWLTPFYGAEAKPLFLEVKSDIDRKFNVSENEWKQAERLEDNYAFMVVLRGQMNTPQCFELLPSPYHLSNDAVGKLTVVPDGRVVSYSI